MYIAKNKKQKVASTRVWPKTSSTETRCFNRYASSVVVILNIVTVYVYCCTCRKSGAGPAAPPHHDDVAGKDLLGHLGSHNPDSEVLPGPVARTRDVDELVIHRLRVLWQTGQSDDSGGAGYSWKKGNQNCFQSKINTCQHELAQKPEAAAVLRPLMPLNSMNHAAGSGIVGQY